MEPITSLKNKRFGVAGVYGVFTICFAGGMFGGLSSALMSSYLPVVVKEISTEGNTRQSEELSAIINSIFLFGMMFGGILLGVAGDKWGRKLSVQLSIAFIGIFMLFTGVANSWMMIVITRFLTGFGVGGVLTTTTILIDELWQERKKAIALGILSITFPVGIFSAGIITYFLSDWRKGFLIGIIPLLLALFSGWWLPESQKWKQSELPGIITGTKKHNLFQKETRYDLVIGCIIYGTMLIGLWAVFAWLPTWVQSMLPSGEGQTERGMSMMLFAFGGLSGGFISGWISNSLGMKKTMIMCFAGTFIFSLILFKLSSSITLFSYIEMAGIAVFFGISQGVLNVYIPELFPVHIRSSATGFCFNAGRIFTATVVFFVGWLVQYLGGYSNALFIFSFIFLLGLIATLFATNKEVVKQTV